MPARRLVGWCILTQKFEEKAHENFPTSANVLAIPLPIPPDAPVTSAAFPLSESGSVSGDGEALIEIKAMDGRRKARKLPGVLGGTVNAVDLAEARDRELPTISLRVLGESRPIIGMAALVMILVMVVRGCAWMRLALAAARVCVC